MSWCTAITQYTGSGHQVKVCLSRAKQHTYGTTMKTEDVKSIVIASRDIFHAADNKSLTFTKSESLRSKLVIATTSATWVQFYFNYVQTG